LFNYLLKTYGKKKGSKAINAHVYKVRQSGEYWIYFGKVSDGVYPVKLQEE
jgi:hypothetical protein